MKLHLAILLLLIGSVLNAQYKTEITVAKDGTGDFTSIQTAIDGTKSFPEKPITIFIKKGVYKEKVKVHSWNTNLTIIGEDASNTIIRWNDHFKKIERGRNSTFHTATLLIQADNFMAKNLTIENNASEVGQAVTVSIEADRCIFENCRMIGNQDTLFADGANARQHFKNCYIEGTTDFIFGRATALFENCIIHCKSNSYITAASTPKGQIFGFVFLKCKLTAAKGIDKVYLGRPWRSYAKTAFINCEMGEHIRPEGWHNWNSPEKEKTVSYVEFGNNGTGSNISKRAPWIHILSKKEAKKYCKKEILKSSLLPNMMDLN